MFHFVAVVGVNISKISLKVMDDINGIKFLLELSIKYIIRHFYILLLQIYGELLVFHYMKKTRL